MHCPSLWLHAGENAHTVLQQHMHTHTSCFILFLQNLVEALVQNNAASFELYRNSSNLVTLLNALFRVSGTESVLRNIEWYCSFIHLLSSSLCNASRTSTSLLLFRVWCLHVCSGNVHLEVYRSSQWKLLYSSCCVHVQSMPCHMLTLIKRL